MELLPMMENFTTMKKKVVTWKTDSHLNVLDRQLKPSCRREIKMIFECKQSYVWNIPIQLFLDYSAKRDFQNDLSASIISLLFYRTSFVQILLWFFSLEFIMWIKNLFWMLLYMENRRFKRYSYFIFVIGNLNDFWLRVELWEN